MDYQTAQILSYSNLIPGIAGLVRLKKINRLYQPFIFLILCGICNDLLSEWLNEHKKGNTINSNIYVLFDYILLLWIFFKWDMSNRSKTTYLVLACAGIFTWAGDNLIFHTITHLNTFFRIFYSLVVVYLSLDQMNFLLLSERKNLLKNARFIISLAFLIFYSYRVVFELFYFVDMKFSNSFYYNLFFIFIYVNVVTNIIFTYAILWIPAKQKFTIAY